MYADKASTINPQVTEALIGAFYTVYNELGAGFMERVYENALVVVLREKGIRVVQQPQVAVYFRGHVVGDYRADLIVEGHIAIEIKAANALVPAHDAQLLNYLRAAGLPLGFLMNFGPKPQFRRRAYSRRPIGVDQI